MTIRRSNRYGLRKTGHLLCLCTLLSVAGTRAHAIITSDGNGTHVTQPGVPMFGVDHDGVCRLTVRTGTGSALCSGTLLEGGRHVLTAAHCVDDENIQSISLRFDLSTGSTTLQASAWEPHPDFSGGHDVGVITLASRAPSEIPRSSPLRSVGKAIDVANYTFGYGVTGYGGTGKESADGDKRGGRNRYEATGATKRVRNLTLGGADDHTWLFSDFDSGLAENDGFGFHFGQSDLGYGNDEVYASSGDSGGPIFVHNGYAFVIAGVVSSGGRFENGPTNPNSDVDGTINGTWGQFSCDSRIAETGNLSFVESFIQPELERVACSLALDGDEMVVGASVSPGDIAYVRFSSALTNSWTSFRGATVAATESNMWVVAEEELAEQPMGFFIVEREKE